MLPYAELMKILSDNNINPEDFSPENMQSIYGKRASDDATMQLIEEMVLATVDTDTPLYDVLAYANDFEKTLGLSEEQSFVCDVLNIVLDNMPVCRENADRLIDLIEDADILDAYNLLSGEYKQFLTAKQIEMLEALSKQTFDGGILL